MPPAETKYHQTQLYRYINCTDNIENNEVKKRAIVKKENALYL